MKIDEATKSILEIIPDDAKIIIARAQENNDDFNSDLHLVQEGGTRLTLTEFANEFIFQMIYSQLSHYINIEEE